MKMLYKYPQRAFPYLDLVETNHRRGKSQPEYELFDTGIFGENRYFDMFIEYAKAAADDILFPSRLSIVDRSLPSCISCLRSGFAIPGVGEGNTIKSPGPH